MTLILRAFAALLVSLAVLGDFACAADVPASSEATPALWTVEKDGKTLYLFGSIHVLPARLDWRRAYVDAAVAASKVFVFEAPVDGGGSGAMSKFIETGGKLPDGTTLQDVLPADLYAKLEDASWKVNYPPMMLKQYRPWLAAVSLELFTYIRAGFSTWYGVDHLLEEEAKKNDRKLDYLETVEEQLSFFSNLSRKAEIAYLRETVRSILEEPASPNDLVDAWASGKPDKMLPLLEDAFTRVPALRAQLLVARNRNWLPKLEAMLASPETHFVTVGVGHLVGPDSVIALLKARGYQVLGPQT